MNTIKYLKDNRIYYPLTPCTWLGQKAEKITDIMMSCGGGMGGAQWHEYIKGHIDLKDGLNTYTRIDDTKVCLNSKWIVKAEFVYLIRAKYIHHNINVKDTMGTEQELLVFSKSKYTELVRTYKSINDYTKEV